MNTSDIHSKKQEKLNNLIDLMLQCNSPCDDYYEEFIEMCWSDFDKNKKKYLERKVGK